MGGVTKAITPTSEKHTVVTTEQSTASTSPHDGTITSPAGEIGNPPHPLVIPAGPPPSYSGHYYAGTVYSGSATTADELKVNIQVPDDHPQSTDFYYVILSVWDSAGSYDQLGFTNDNGVWGIAWSTTSSCAGTYYYSPDAGTLHQGQTYLFDMYINSGTVYFTIFNSGGSEVWSHSYDTGGSTFEVEGFYSCNSSSYYDYTDYEEVYDTSGPVPPYVFFFSNNWANSFGYVGTWGIWTSSTPSGVTVYINGGSSSNGCPSSCPITVANEPYYTYFTNGLDSTTVEPTTALKTYHWDVTVAEMSSDSPIYITNYYAPNGWTLNFVPTQGTPPFVYQVSFSFPDSTIAGNYYIGLVAFDGSGSYNRVALNVVVLSAVTASPSGSPGSGGIDLGQSVTLSANPQGGSGGYAYSWPTLPPGCSTSSGATVSCTPSAAGAFTVAVMVTDSLGYSASGAISYTVDTDPTVATPAASPTSVDVGQPVTFSTSASGGSGGFAYSWAGLPLGCSGTTASLTCSPAAAVTDASVTVAVTDSNGFSVRSSILSITVYGDPTVMIPTASRASADVGQTVTFSTSGSGGSGGLAYSWVGLPSGCSGTTTTITCSPVRAVSDALITATVTDSNGFSVTSGALSFTVYADPTVSVPTASSGSVLEGNSVTFNVSATQGSGGLSYAWSGLPPGCTSVDLANVTCTPTSPGTYQIVVEVTDSNGVQATSLALSFTVNPTFLGLPALEGYAVLAGIVAAVVVAGLVAAVLLTRRRKQKQVTSAPQGAQQSPSPPPPPPTA